MDLIPGFEDIATASLRTKITGNQRWMAKAMVEMADQIAKMAEALEALELDVETSRAERYRAGREDAARDIERPGSILCSCSDCDNPPTNWKTRARMDHHCDCAAVEAAATMLGAYSKTNHAQQCVHGTEFDEYYQADQPRTVSPGEQGDNPEEQR